MVYSSYELENDENLQRYFFFFFLAALVHKFKSSRQKIRFVGDHPFLFTIGAYNTILFTGKLNNL